MLSLKLPVVPIDVSIQAGVHIQSVCLDPQPGRLLEDGSLVNIATFPELFEKLGHFHTTGTYVGNGTENGKFRLPDPRGRFFRPMNSSNAPPGTLRADTVSQHTHVFSTGTGVEPNHLTGALPGGGGSYGLGTEKFDAGAGVRTGITVTTSTAGGHGHAIYASNNTGPDTAPYNVAVPTYINVGRGSNTAVVLIPGGGWIACPGYNEISPNLTNLANEMAKENYHVYRLKYPIAKSGSPSFPAAHLEIKRQLEIIRTLYKHVYVIGTSAGAHLGGLALNANPLLADAFIGIYGIYNLNGEVSAGFHTAYTDIFLGSSSASARLAASVSPMTIPTYLVHGKNDVLVPYSQSVNFNANLKLMDTFAHSSNIVSTGVVNDIKTFINSLGFITTN